MDFIIIFIAQYLYLAVIVITAIFFLTRPRIVQKSMIVCGLITAPLSYVLAMIAGALYYDPRPFVIGHFTPLFFHIADNGFPSDHVLLTGAIAAVIFFYNKKLSIVLWILAILIGLARVYAGVHHLIDIAGSVVIVFIAMTVYYWLADKKHLFFGHKNHLN